MIIAIHGKLGSGKDTAAQMVYDMLDSCETLRFAHGVKETAAIITGTSVRDQHTREGKDRTEYGFNMSNGRIQQAVGEGLRNLISDDIWVNKWLRRWKSSRTDHVVVPDLRYPNEAEALLSRGAILIKIEGDPEHVRYPKQYLKKYLNGGSLRKWWTDIFFSHSDRDLRNPSETSLDDFPNFTYTYRNDGSLLQLESWLKTTISNHTPIKSKRYE